MKQYIKSLLLVAVAACAAACGMDSLSTPQKPIDESKGYLQLGSVLLNGDTENAVVGAEPATSRATSEADGGFYIEVLDKTTGAAAWSGDYAEVKGRTIGLEPGTYVVYAYQTRAKVPAVGAAVDAPYYAGQSDVLEIVSKQTRSTTITCRQANILTTVELSADLKAVFKPYEAGSEKRLKTEVKVGIESLTNAYTYEAESTHEQPLVYFTDVAGPNAQSGNTMTITLSGEYYTGDPVDVLEGRADETKWKEVKMVKTVTNVRAAQWRKISIDIDHNTTGDVKFEFVIESYIYDEEIVVDVVTLYEEINLEESIPDEEEENPAAPDVTINGQEELTFNLNSSLYDADAEMWTSTLKVNVTPKDGTTVAGIYAVFASTNSSLLAAMEQKGFAEGRIDLFPANAAQEYATVSAEGTTITLKASGMDALYKYAGTHTVSVYTLDSQNRMKHTDLTIVVSSEAVAGPSIVWYVNGAPATTLLSDGSETAHASITSVGLTGLSVQIISDILTPEELGGLGLATEMDLFNPATAVMETRLRAFRFLPVDTTAFPEGTKQEDMAAGDDKYRLFDPATGERKAGVESPLKGQTSVTFTVTDFLPLLAALENIDNAQYKSTNSFVLTASDEEGTTTSSMTINVKR